MNPETETKPRALPGAGSLASRIAYAAGGLLILIILFSVVKGLVAGGPDLTPYLGVAQDQQSIIHLTTAAAQQKGLSVTTQNFVSTAQLTVSSNQADLISYLVRNGDKVKPQSLGLKISASTDNQLTAAATNSTYDQTFQTVMNTQLTTYINDLKSAYAKETGKNGRALLSSDYDQAQLLLTQLKSR